MPAPGNRERDDGSGRRPGPHGRAVRQPRLLPICLLPPRSGSRPSSRWCHWRSPSTAAFMAAAPISSKPSSILSGSRTTATPCPTGGTQALEVTAIYTVGFIVLAMGFGLATALLLNMKLPGFDRLRAPFIIPVVVPVVATALIWANLFAPQFGFINRILEAVGLHQADFTSSPSLALIMVLSFGVVAVLR